MGLKHRKNRMKRRIYVQPGTYELRKINSGSYDQHYNHAFVSSHRAISESCRKEDDQTDRKTPARAQTDIFPDSTCTSSRNGHNSCNTTANGATSNKDSNVVNDNRDGYGEVTCSNGDGDGGNSSGNSRSPNGHDGHGGYGDYNSKIGIIGEDRPNVKASHESNPYDAYEPLPYVTVPSFPFQGGAVSTVPDPGVALTTVPDPGVAVTTVPDPGVAVATVPVPGVAESTVPIPGVTASTVPGIEGDAVTCVLAPDGPTRSAEVHQSNRQEIQNEFDDSKSLLAQCLMFNDQIDQSLLQLFQETDLGKTIDYILERHDEAADGRLMCDFYESGYESPILTYQDVSSLLFSKNLLQLLTQKTVLGRCTWSLTDSRCLTLLQLANKKCYDKIAKSYDFVGEDTDCTTILLKMFLATESISESTIMLLNLVRFWTESTSKQFMANWMCQSLFRTTRKSIIPLLPNGLFQVNDTQYLTINGTIMLVLDKGSMDFDQSNGYIGARMTRCIHNARDESGNDTNTGVLLVRSYLASKVIRLLKELSITGMVTRSGFYFTVEYSSDDIGMNGAKKILNNWSQLGQCMVTNITTPGIHVLKPLILEVDAQHSAVLWSRPYAIRYGFASERSKSEMYLNEIKKDWIHNVRLTTSPNELIEFPDMQKCHPKVPLVFPEEVKREEE